MAESRARLGGVTSLWVLGRLNQINLMPPFEAMASPSDHFRATHSASPASQTGWLMNVNPPNSMPAIQSTHGKRPKMIHNLKVAGYSGFLTAALRAASRCASASASASKSSLRFHSKSPMVYAIGLFSFFGQRFFSGQQVDQALACCLKPSSFLREKNSKL